MFTEILKILPQLDRAALNSMVKTLSNRFTDVAKKFGGGLKKAVLTGGLAGLATGLIDKLLNPLQETEEVLKRIMGSSDDLVTSAKQFETTSGKLFKLQQLGKSVGMDEDTLRTALGKFQIALAEARRDEKDTEKTENERNENPARAFIGFGDTVDAFVEFQRAIKAAPKDDQVLFEQKIFGEKLMGKLAEFFQTDLAEQLKVIGARPSEDYTPAIEKIGSLADLADALTAKQTLADIFPKEQAVNEGAVRSMAQRDQQNLDRENQRLKSIDSMIQTSIATQAMSNKMEELFLYLNKQVPLLLVGVTKLEEAVNWFKPHVTTAIDYLKSIVNSPFMRGVTGGVKKMLNWK